jgi:hypothetical protein
MGTNPINDDDDFEIIPESEMIRASRGRKPSPDAMRIAQILGTLKTGQVVALKGFAVDVKSKDLAILKARVGAQIRSGANSAGVNVSIAWHPTSGVPQVKVVS